MRSNTFEISKNYTQRTEMGLYSCETNNSCSHCELIQTLVPSQNVGAV